MIIVIMGVMGSGKTTIGQHLAQALGCEFLDGDNFHPESNKRKMSEGIPLTDADRLPWLEKLWQEIKKREGKLLVLACSALKKSYRDLLSKGIQVQWVYLKGDRETIQKRIEGRKGHFAGPDLLDSQMKTLEEPADALEVDIQKEPDVIVHEMIRSLKEKGDL